MKPQIKKGFTLIELMIVVAIIWVLAVTIVPALTWAQARARDAGRVASLQNISAVLETYFSDIWQFPSATAVATTTWEVWKLNCISDTKWKTATDLQPMFKWWTVPLNPQLTSLSATCGQAGAYFYAALNKGWITKAWYILMADIEAFAKSNATLSWATAIVSDAATPTYETVTQSTWWGSIEWWKITTEVPTWAAAWGWPAWTWWAKNSVYALAN